MRSPRPLRALIALAVLAMSAVAVSTLPPISEARAEDELTPRQILDKSLDQNGLGISSGLATVKLTVDKKGDGKTEVKELRIESRRDADNDDDTKSRITLLAPADMAGEAYLFLANAEREDDVYMFLPAFKETRKVSGSDKTGSFLGTHLTYRDLETRDLEDGEARRLPDEKIGPHDCYVIEATPPADEETDYGRVVTWVRKKDYMPLRVEFYDQDGKLDKRMFSKKISKQDGTRYVKMMRIEPESGGSTTMEIVDIDFDAELPDRTFSKDALGQ